MGWGYGMGFGGIESLFLVFFVIMFLVVIGTFIASAASSASQWHRDNESPVLTVEAQVVTKRTSVGYTRHSGHSRHYTDYYVTFQVESGDRMELEVSGDEYGLLAEGDQGKLTFQGSRYQGFQRS